MALLLVSWSGFLCNPTLLLLLFVVAALLLKSLSRPRNLPPGPMPIPFYGNIVSDKDPHVYYTDLSKKYGDLYSIKYGRHYMVVLNSADVIKEALVKKPADFAGRPQRFTWANMSENRKNIMFGDYDQDWKIQRKMTHQALRNYVSGENLETLIHDNIFPQIQKSIDATKGKAFDPRATVLSMVSTVIASLCFGRHYTPEDPEFTHVMDMIDNIFHKTGNGLIEDKIPIMQYFPSRRAGELREACEKFQDFVQGKINEHRMEFDPDNTKDFIDNMIKLQQEKTRDDGQSVFTDVQLRQTVGDMFVAGTDTTGNTLYWSIAYMVNYPDVQVKVQQEIDDVIGRDRLPGLADREHLPYCDAVIHELMRIKPVAALAITHSTTCDTTLRNYEIPKDTLVTINLAAVHRNEKEWENPEEFRPERFLDVDNERRILKPDSFMPFSAGRRVCVGDVLAKAELFIIFCSLFQNFTFSTVPGKNPPGLDEYCEALILRCYPYEVTAKRRF